MTTRKPGSKAKKAMRTAEDLNEKSSAVIKDLKGVFKKHGLPQTAHITFRGANSGCTCPDGRQGVLRIVGNKFVCDCG